MFICCVQKARPTAYFYLSANGAFYIAGDTVQIEEAVDSQSYGVDKNSSFKTGCKMIVSDKYVVAVAGDTGHATFHLDPIKGWLRGKNSTIVKDQAKSILSRPGTADSKFQELIRTAQYAAKEEFDYRKKLNKAEVAPGYIDLILFSLDNGVATARMFSAFSELKNHQIITKIEGVLIAPIPDGGIRASGESKAISSYPVASRQQILRSPVDVLNTYMQRQTTLTPNLVRPPYVIFRLTSSGGDWVQHGEVCKAYSVHK